MLYLKILHLIVFFFIKSSFFINFETKTPHRFNFKRRTAVGKLFLSLLSCRQWPSFPHNFQSPIPCPEVHCGLPPCFVFGKVIEQIEFRAGKSDVFPVKFSLFFIDIYDNISNSDFPYRVIMHFVQFYSSKYAFYPGNEFHGTERLCKVIVTAQREACYFVRLSILGGYNYNWNGALTADCWTKGKSVYFWHHYIYYK